MILVQNSFQHALDVAENVVVPETHDVIAPLFKNTGPLGVARLAKIVLTAIDLDNEFQIERHKIHNVAPDWHLTLELDAVETPSTKFGPQKFFGFGRALAESPRTCSWAEPPHPTLSPPGRGFHAELHRATERSPF